MEDWRRRAVLALEGEARGLQMWEPMTFVSERDHDVLGARVALLGRVGANERGTTAIHLARAPGARVVLVHPPAREEVRTFVEGETS